MRALLGLFTVILSLFTFFSTAYADVIDPNNPYHKPPRPPVKPIPVTRVYRMRDPSFTLTKVKEKKEERIYHFLILFKNSFLFFIINL